MASSIGRRRCLALTQLGHSDCFTLKRNKNFETAILRAAISENSGVYYLHRLHCVHLNSILIVKILGHHNQNFEVSSIQIGGRVSGQQFITYC